MGKASRGARSRHPGRMLRAGTAAAVALVALVGCTASEPGPSPTRSTSEVVSQGWTEIPVPTAGARVLVFLIVGNRTLALGSVWHGSTRAPAAWSTTDFARWTALTVHPVTGYGRLAEFTMGAVDTTDRHTPGRIVAWGQAFGGAHSNPRPTTWTGSPGAPHTSGMLTEHEQPFTMFGGEDAIATDAEAAYGGTMLLAGSWDSRTTLDGPGRYGAAVWLSGSGTTWTRHTDLAGLSSSNGEQTSAVGAAAGPTGFVLVGASARYGQSGPPSTALAWFSNDGLAWQRVALPNAESAVASRVACGSRACTMIGSTFASEQHLICWRTDAAGRVTETSDGPGRGLVDVTGVVAEQASVADAPTTSGADAANAATDRIWTVADFDHVARLFTLSSDCSGWTPMPMPTKAETAVVTVLHDRVVMATSNSDASRLWVRSVKG
ncbi:hypothetical protein HII28_17165 [Planctomonas sp. JC2975]|uniref:hypothetical protein n=1 Tax=Planctomonas sp. JC2975 TaxID=2729626 RepID=UPI001475FA43|nr:hypothetical protein [Planctomonas sp. JC2975]NNC13599.1 hypothetical protein [Planctomonas sp. JC2975]